MANEYSSSIDSDALDDTLLSFPELYIGYVHPALMATLRLILAVLTYCVVGLFRLILVATRTLLWPIYTMGRFFIVPPVSFIYHVCRGLYPIAVFLSVAVICGVIIGCCAGFTAEALSSFFINATWGPPSKPAVDNAYEEEEEEEYEDDLDSFNEDDSYNNYDYLDELATEDETSSHRDAKTSTTFRQSPLSALSSIWNNKKQVLEDDSYSDEDDGHSNGFNNRSDFALTESTTTALASPEYGRKRIRGKGKEPLDHRSSMASAAYSQNEFRLNQPQMTHLGE